MTKMLTEMEREAVSLPLPGVQAPALPLRLAALERSLPVSEEARQQAFLPLPRVRLDEERQTHLLSFCAKKVP